MEFYSDVLPDYTSFYRAIGRAAKWIANKFVLAFAAFPEGPSLP